LSAVEPLREIFAGTGVVIHQGKVEKIDVAEKKVHTGTHTLLYDTLILSTGAENNYYNTAGAAEHTFGLKNLADALAIRNQIIDSFEKASFTEDEQERKKNLRFVVVGGGPTGVEIVTELAEFAYAIEERYYKSPCHFKRTDIDIHLVSAGPELLVQVSPILRAFAKERLEKLGITMHLGVQVQGVESDAVLLSTGEKIDTHTVIWAAGVKATFPELVGHTPELVGGRIVVDEYFRLKNRDDVFVLGDVAAKVDEKNPKGVPMVAQAAVAQAETVAHNVLAVHGFVKHMKTSVYVSKGTLVSLGQWSAVGDVAGHPLAGAFMWWVWRTVYLFKFHSWSKRFRIAFDWTINIFYPRDITKL
jgi:NADH dehydrogenase